MKPVLILLLIVAACLHAAGAQAPAPDAIYYHGHILTGEGLDRNSTQFVTAIAIYQGNIVAASDDQSTLKLAGTATRKIDLAEAFVMPGFNDAHLHLGEAGRIKLSVDLTGAASLEDLKKRVLLAAATTAKGGWLAGGGWDHTLWANRTLPTRNDLDAVTQGHPAIFTRIDGHIAVANTAALEAAWITRNTHDPAGGKIDRDAQGEATGILREASAMRLVSMHTPPPTDADRQRGLALAMADAVSHGVTSAQDNSNWEDFLVMEKMESEGKLPLRVTEWLAFDDPLEVLKQHRNAHDPADRMLHTGMLKGFMDGSLGSRTASMKTPYTDDPGNSGIPRYDAAALNRMTKEREGAGFQIGFHAIGDSATAIVLSAFDSAHQPSARQEPLRRRNRIEHAQVVDPADIGRFKSLGIVASMQPNHLLTDMRWAEARLGPERAKYSYAWKAFLDAGVPLAFGTDYPVEPVTPFRGVYAAVTRKDEKGQQSYYPENALTLAQTLYAYTQGSAYAEYSEAWKGKLAPGYVADFIILDRNLTAIAPGGILETQVKQTVVGGRPVYVGGIKIAR